MSAIKFETGFITFALGILKYSHPFQKLWKFKPYNEGH